MGIPLSSRKAGTLDPFPLDPGLGLLALSQGNPARHLLRLRCRQHDRQTVGSLGACSRQSTPFSADTCCSVILHSSGEPGARLAGDGWSWASEDRWLWLWL